MNKPGSFKREINWPGWGVALACAAGAAEIVVRFIFPLIAKVI